MSRYLILAVALLMPAVALSAESQLVATGTGVITAEPDEASINLAVVTRDEQCTEALRKNSEAMENLYKALGGFKINHKDVRTVRFSIEDNIKRDNNGNITREGFLVVNMIHITVRELSIFGKVLDAAVAGGINHVQGISFSSSKSAEHVDQARLAAVDDAKRKAQIVARRLGHRLVRVASVNEGSNYGGRSIALSSTRDASVPISEGTLDYSVNVNIVWEIAPEAACRGAACCPKRHPIPDKVHPDTKNTLVPDPGKSKNDLDQ